MLAMLDHQTPSLVTAKTLLEEIVRLRPLAKTAADVRHLSDLQLAWEAAAQSAVEEMRAAGRLRREPPLRREAFV